MRDTTPLFPDKKYSIIYADPAWDCGSHVLRGECHARNRYEVIPFSVMETLPVESIANDDSLLFMWVLSHKLLECCEVGKQWGFKFITIGFVWEKEATLSGNYTLPSVELCLIFKRGKIPQPRGKRNIRQFLSVKKGSHSVKPLQVRERITEMFPTQSKIELFARPNILDYNRGWDFWGNEVTGDW